MAIPTPPNGPLSSSELKKRITDTPPPKGDPAAFADEAVAQFDSAAPGKMSGSVVDMSLPPVADKAESSDIFSPGGRRGGSDILSKNGPSAEGLSDLFTGESSRGSNSDVLSAKLKSGESDVLAAMLSGNESDILADSSSRGSSQFDDPVHATEPISAPVPRADDSTVATDMPDAVEGEELTDRMPRPDIEESNDVTQEIFLSDEEIDMESGLDLVPPWKLRGSKHSDPAGDGDDIFGDKTVPEFDGGAASGVDLLDPGVSATARAGPASGVNLLNPHFGGTTPAEGYGPTSGNPSSARLNPRNPSPTRSGNSGTGKGRPHPPSSLITPEDLTKDVKPGAENSDLFADMGQGTNPPGGTRSSIMPGVKNQPSDAVSFDMPDNRIKQPERLRGYEGSGMIDWSEGAGMDSDQLSQRMQSVDEHTELEIDLHEGLMADAAQGKGFTKIVESKSKPAQIEPGALATSTKMASGKKSSGQKVRPSRGTTPKDAGVTGASRGSLSRGIAVGAIAASVVGFGFFFSGVFALQNSKVNDRNYGLLKDGNSKLNADNTKLEENLKKTQALADALRAERDRQSTDRVKIGEEKLKLERDNAALKAQAQDASALKAERDKLATTQKALSDELAAARSQATRAANTVTEKDRLAAEARTAAAAAEAKLKAADAALDAVVIELKKADWLDPKADRTAALAALPGAIKKAAEGTVAVPNGGAAIAGTVGPAGQLFDLAKKAANARDEAVKAKTDAAATRDAAEKTLALAKADAQKTASALEAKIRALTESKNDDVQRAVATIRTDLEGKVAAADTRAAAIDSERRAAIEAYERKLQTQAEEFRKDLSLARAGIAASVTDGERRATDRAERLYGDGVMAYFAGRWADAETALAASTQADAADARRWYFLGLARWALGNPSAAKEAFKSGAAWEARNTPPAKQVGAALERIQGPARRELDAIRP